MAGSVTPYPHGPQPAWRLRVGAGEDPARPGRYRQVQRIFRGSHRKAETALAALITEVERGQHKVSAVTFGDLLDEWLELGEPAWSPTTHQGYKWVAETRLKPLRRVTLAKLGTHHFARLYADMTAEGLSPKSVRQTHAVARAALEQARAWGWIAANPAAAMKGRLPRDDRDDAEIDPPTFDELLSIVAAAATSTRADRAAQKALMARAIVVGGMLGVRRGELCGLRWGDVDLERATVKVHRAVVALKGRGLLEKSTKTNKVRRFDLDPLVVSVLVAQRAYVEQAAAELRIDLEPNGYVFSPEPDGSVPFRPDSITQAWGRACKAAGVEGRRLHDLRHLAASRLIQDGVPIAEISRRLGHANIGVTQVIYGHLLRDAVPQAPAALAAAYADVVDVLELSTVQGSPNAEREEAAPPEGGAADTTPGGSVGI